MTDPFRACSLAFWVIGTSLLVLFYFFAPQNPEPGLCSSSEPLNGAWHFGSPSRYAEEQLWFEPRCRLTLPDARHLKWCFPAGSKIAVLGDSQGVHYTTALLAYLGNALGCGFQVERRGSRCNESRVYFGYDQDGQCRGCAGCDARLLRSTGCRANLTVEYIAMEHVFDHEIRSSQYNTTQENIFKLHWKKDPPVALLMNAGLHDLGRMHPTTYAQHLAWLLTFALQAVPRTVWALTTPPLGEKQPVAYRNITSATNALAFNAVAQRLLRKHGVLVLDAYMLASSAPVQVYSDGVHFHGYHDTFYRTVLQIFLHLQCPTVPPD